MARSFLRELQVFDKPVSDVSWTVSEILVFDCNTKDISQQRDRLTDLDRGVIGIAKLL